MLQNENRFNNIKGKKTSLTYLYNPNHKWLTAK